MGWSLNQGVDFTIRVSSLTEPELLDLIPRSATELHRDITSRAFSELQRSLSSGSIAKFTIDDLLNKMQEVGPQLRANEASVTMAISRTASLKRDPIFGEGINRADWREYMYPCLAINCKHLTTTQLQPVATAVLRELQTLRLS